MRVIVISTGHDQRRAEFAGVSTETWLALTALRHEPDAATDAIAYLRDESGSNIETERTLFEPACALLDGH